MKKTKLLLVVLVVLAQGLMAQETPPKEYQARYQEVMKQTQWWREARFGMFIHFGAYAVPGRGRMGKI